MVNPKPSFDRAILPLGRCCETAAAKFSGNRPAALGGYRVQPELYFAGRGALTGLAIAAPVGPIGILCIRSALSHGFRNGLAVGMGAASADALYGAVAACGLTAVSNILVRWQTPVQLGGGLFLCYLGWVTFRSQPAKQNAGTISPHLAKTYAATVVLTLTNPATILSFIAIFAGLGLGAAPDPSLAGATVLGVFLGSALWWVLLSGVASALSAWINDRAMGWINRTSGMILVAFGAVALAHVLWTRK